VRDDSPVQDLDGRGLQRVAELGAMRFVKGALEHAQVVRPVLGDIRDRAGRLVHLPGVARIREAL